MWKLCRTPGFGQECKDDEEWNYQGLGISVGQRWKWKRHRVGECYLWNTRDSNEDKAGRILSQFKTSSSDYRAFRSLP